MIDLEKLTLVELLEVQKRLPTLIAYKQDEVRKDVLQKTANLAAKYGLTLDDLVSKGRKRISVRYVNPSDPSQTWSGVGSRPRWVRDLIAAGWELDALKLKEVEDEHNG